MTDEQLKYFMGLARYVGEGQSTCRRKVGSCIVNPKTLAVVSTGFAAAPEHVTSCASRGGCYRDKHQVPPGTAYDTKCVSIHAEARAIMRAGIYNTVDCFLFIADQTHICDFCKRDIVEAKIAMVYLQDRPEDPIRQIYRLELMKELNNKLK